MELLEIKCTFVFYSELKSMVKQKPQPRKPKDELALDVRTDLVQAEDLLVRQFVVYCPIKIV